MEKKFFVYVLASKRNGTLCVGVTSALIQRVWQHKTKAVGGFTARCGVDQLVYVEAHGDAPPVRFSVRNSSRSGPGRGRSS
jgi:putative endonuclease